jgi:hypothetical protein
VSSYFDSNSTGILVATDLRQRTRSEMIAQGPIPALDRVQVPNTLQLIDANPLPPNHNVLSKLPVRCGDRCAQLKPRVLRRVWGLFAVVSSRDLCLMWSLY